MYVLCTHVGQSSSFKYSCTEEVEETRELLLCTKRNIEELLIKGVYRSTVCACVCWR